MSAVHGRDSGFAITFQREALSERQRAPHARLAT
jgi:hypothetical protein